MDIDDAMRGGPIGHFGLSMSLQMIEELKEYVYTLRNEKDAVLKDCSFPGPYGGDIFVALACEREFVSVACSQTMAAAICPLFETLFSRAFERIRDACNGSAPLNNHIRWIATVDKSDEYKRWSPSWVFNENGRLQKNFIEGYQQVLEGIGFETAIPKSSLEAQTIFALFYYRNRSLHHGYEWPDEKRRAFVTNIEDQNWSNWFDVCMLDGQPWLIAMKKVLVHDAIASVKTVADKLYKIEKISEERRTESSL